MKLLFPDACWTRDIVSGGLFLYFHNEKVGLTLHPSVSTFMTGIDPFDFIRFVEDRRPDWLPKFSEFIRTWMHYQSSLRQTTTLLEPLRGRAFVTIWMSYPKGSAAWQSAEELLASCELERDEIEKLIDPFSAADELFSHIFFEKYLELYKGHLKSEEIIALGAEAGRLKSLPQQVQVDWGTLFEYCGALFKDAELSSLLATAYMFRIPILKDMPAILLSNHKIVRLLGSLPFQVKPVPGEKSTEDIDFDVVAWEFFRQLVSPRVDPIDEKQVENIVQLIQHHSTEIDALKRCCLRLALDLG